MQVTASNGLDARDLPLEVAARVGIPDGLPRKRYAHRSTSVDAGLTPRRTARSGLHNATITTAVTPAGTDRAGPSLHVRSFPDS